MPTTFHLTLQLLEPAPADARTGLHAVVHDLISQVDPDLAARTHAAQVSALSLGYARYGGFGGILGQDRQTLQVRVRCLDDALTPVLRQAFLPGTFLKTEPTNSASSSAEQAAPPRLLGRVAGCLPETVSYAELQDGPPPPHLTLHFLSPTVLKSGDVAVSRPRADLILHGLLRRWNAFAPQPQPEQAWAAAHEASVEIHELERHHISMPKRPPQQRTPAFSGSVTLHFGSPVAALHLAPVVRLAEWSGIGTKTLYGMGEAAVQ
jgi:hypothetical protein